MTLQPEWATVVVTLVLGVAGVYVGHSYRRQTRLGLASDRLEAYSRLWELTGLAAPTRLDERTGMTAVEEPFSRSLSAEERARLYGDMTTWYYRDGNGMLLGSDTRNVYMRAKHNLVCADADLEPEELRDLLRREQALGPDRSLSDAERGCYSIRQLSLLRSQMKADLAIYGEPFVRTLEAHEREFLRGCGVSLLRQPWRRAHPNRLVSGRWRSSRRSDDLARPDRTSHPTRRCRDPGPRRT